MTFFFSSFHSFIIYLSVKWQKQKVLQRLSFDAHARALFLFVFWLKILWNCSFEYHFYSYSRFDSHFTACKNPIKSSSFRFEKKKYWWNKRTWTLNLNYLIFFLEKTTRRKVSYGTLSTPKSWMVEMSSDLDSIGIFLIKNANQWHFLFTSIFFNDERSFRKQKQ